MYVWNPQLYARLAGALSLPHLQTLARASGAMSTDSVTLGGDPPGVLSEGRLPGREGALSGGSWGVASKGAEWPALGT